jgi:hypothetical protein
MAHDRQLPIGDREEERPADSPLLRIVPLTPRLSAALATLDSFCRALFVPSQVVRRRLQAAIDEVETAVREALKEARGNR